MNLNLARRTLKGILAFDRPIGQLMEFVKLMEDNADNLVLKDCCGTLLSLQLELIEQLTTAYPELRQDLGE